MAESDDFSNTRAMLSALGGGAIDWARLEGDLGRLNDFLAILAQLWEYPVVASHPAGVFSAAWEDSADDD
jgi:hypothetical protein